MDGRDDEFVVARQLLHQGARVRRAVDAALAETVELLGGLIIQILAVHHKNDLVYARQIGQDLTRFKGSQRLARTRRVPHVAEFARRFDPLDNRLDRVKLIRAQDHQHLGGLVEHHVFGNHLGEVTRLQKRISEGGQLRNQFVFRRRPVKGLFKLPHFDGIIGEVLGIDSVADHKKLHKLKQPVTRRETVSLVAIDLIKRFFEFKPAPFEFDLYQRQAVDENGDVVTVFAFASHRNLLRHLKFILTPMNLIDKFKGLFIARVGEVGDAVAQHPGPVVDIALAEKIEHLPKLRRAQPDLIVLFQLLFKIGRQVFFVADDRLLVAQTDELRDEGVFEDLLGLGGHVCCVCLNVKCGKRIVKSQI